MVMNASSKIFWMDLFFFLFFLNVCNDSRNGSSGNNIPFTQNTLAIQRNLAFFFKKSICRRRCRRLISATIQIKNQKTFKSSNDLKKNKNNDVVVQIYIFSHYYYYYWWWWWDEMRARILDDVSSIFCLSLDTFEIKQQNKNQDAI